MQNSGKKSKQSSYLCSCKSVPLWSNCIQQFGVFTHSSEPNCLYSETSSHFSEFSGFSANSLTSPFNSAPFLGHSGGPGNEDFPFMGSARQYMPVQWPGCLMTYVVEDDIEDDIRERNSFVVLFEWADVKCMWYMYLSKGFCYRLLQNLLCMHHRSINQQQVIIIRIPYSHRFWKKLFFRFRFPKLETVLLLGYCTKINRNSHNRSYSFWTFWADISDSTVAKMESNSKQCIRR